MAWIHVLLLTWIVSMVTSMEFVLSQAMILLSATAVFGFQPPAGRSRWQVLASLWRRRMAEQPAWLAPVVFFLLVWISGLWSAEWGYWLERLRIKSAFAILPFAFMALPEWRREDMLMVLYTLLWVVVLAAVWVLVNYCSGYEQIMAGLGRGQHMPTPSNHIRFSLTVALAILGGIVLWRAGYHLWHPLERRLVAGFCLFLFAFIHLLSVRSGIAALYAGLLTGSLVVAWQRRQWWVGMAVALLIAAAPLAAYELLPSFRKRVDYAMWDWKQYRQGQGSQYSDSERLASLRAGWHVWQSHFWLGVGAGDLKAAMAAAYEELFAERQFSPKLPHNQLLTVAAGTGLAGLAAFAIAFSLPALAFRPRRQALRAADWFAAFWLAFHAAIFTSFLVENTFEGNYGVSLYSLLLLAGMRYLSDSLPKEVQKTVGST